MTDPSTPASPTEVHDPAATPRERALALLRGWTAPGPAQEARRRDFLGHLERHVDGLERGCFPGHLTASTLIVSADRGHVLLTLHVKARAWFQMGGHWEPADADLLATARREAVEESGVETLTLDPWPVQLDAHDVDFCHPRGTVQHLDVRFVATAPASAVHAVSEESVDVRWWPVDDLPSREPGMVELVRLGRERLAGAGQSTGSSAAI